MTKPGVSIKGLRRLYRILVHLAWCDGACSPREKEYLQSFKKQADLSDEEAQVLHEEAKQGVSLVLGKREAERELLVRCMLDLTLVDGVLSGPEQERLSGLGEVLGLSQHDLAVKIQERVRKSGRQLRPEE